MGTRQDAKPAYPARDLTVSAKVRFGFAGGPGAVGGETNVARGTGGDKGGTIVLVLLYTGVSLVCIAPRVPEQENCPMPGTIAQLRPMTFLASGRKGLNCCIGDAVVITPNQVHRPVYYANPWPPPGDRSRSHRVPTIPDGVIGLNGR